MAQQTINIGSAPNDGTGTPLRDAFDMVNDNFTENYTTIGEVQTAVADAGANANSALNGEAHDDTARQSVITAQDAADGAAGIASTAQEGVNDILGQAGIYVGSNLETDIGEKLESGSNIDDCLVTPNDGDPATLKAYLEGLTPNFIALGAGDAILDVSHHYFYDAVGLTTSATLTLMGGGDNEAIELTVNADEYYGVSISGTGGLSFSIYEPSRLRFTYMGGTWIVEKGPIVEAGSAGGYTASSADFQLIETAVEKTFNIGPGYSFFVGGYVRATNSTLGHWMEGVVTDYTDGALTVSMQVMDPGGEGLSYSEWTVNGPNIMLRREDGWGVGNSGFIGDKGVELADFPETLLSEPPTQIELQTIQNQVAVLTLKLRALEWGLAQNPPTIPSAYVAP